MASFKKLNSIYIQLEVNGKQLLETCEVADGFSKQFQSPYDMLVLVSPRHSLHFEFLFFSSYF
jgi:hypothetical protein